MENFDLDASRIRTAALRMAIKWLTIWTIINPLNLEVLFYVQKKNCNELFWNQQSLWKDNNKLMRDFMEFMKNNN